MPGTSTIVDARGRPAIPTDLDFGFAVVGCATSSPVAAGQLTAAYNASGPAVEDLGLGDAVDCVTQILTPTSDNPAPAPLSVYVTPVTTPGVRGTLDTSGVTGTAVVTQTAATYPVGTFEPLVRVADDGNGGAGGLIGSTGIILEGSLDNGRTWLPEESLGTALTWKIRELVNGSYVDTGVQYDLAPATTNAVLVALAVELRADFLAHMADGSVHDGADTGAYQVALNANPVPTNVSEAMTTVNLVRTAAIGHFANITTVHNGPDDVNIPSLGAATDTKTTIDLAIQLKAKINLHRAATRAAATTGLKTATAVDNTGTQTFTAADCLSGGIVALDAYPCRLIFTVTEGTPGHAPDSVSISGTVSGVAQTETLALSAGANPSVKAWDGTGLSWTYVQADGADATIAVGYGQAVHNSADAAHAITSTDPTYGTLKTGDTWGESRTTPPMWAAADLYAAGPPATGAFAAIAASQQAFGVVVLTEPIVSADYDGVTRTTTVFSTLVAGLNHCATRGKRLHLVTRFRDQLSTETDAQFVAAFQAFKLAYHDKRIECVAGDGWVTEPFRGFRYYRNGLAPYMARVASFNVVKGRVGERLAQNPGWVARGPLPNFTIRDDGGHPIAYAHDELQRSGIEAPSGASYGGGICFCWRNDASSPGTYVTNRVSTLFAPGDAEQTPMDNRLANGMKTIAQQIVTDEIGGADIWDPDSLELDADLRQGLEVKIAKEESDRYGSEFQNPTDPGLCAIDPVVVVDGSLVTLTGTLAPRFYGWTDGVTLTFSASR